jgi:hypothetical protein
MEPSAGTGWGQLMSGARSRRWANTPALSEVVEYFFVLPAVTVAWYRKANGFPFAEPCPNLPLLNHATYRQITIYAVKTAIQHIASSRGNTVALLSGTGSVCGPSNPAGWCWVGLK